MSSATEKRFEWRIASATPCFKTMGPDLKDKRWIVLKGILFAFLALLSGGLQIASDLPLWQEALLLLICVWAACRFYYFLFHVLHAYVDPTLPSAGILDLVKRIRPKDRK
jgi:hypothetical protein